MGSVAKDPDYYELLSISASASESEIRRAYRKTSLLYHPDKVANFTPEIAEKFQHVQKALDVLTNAEEKQKYDQSRQTKLRLKAEHDALESRRRKLKEDLEAGERGAAANSAGTNVTKRTWTQRDLDIKRIAEENRRKREAACLRKAQEAHERAAAEAAAEKEESSSSDSMDRSVKVRWIREGEGLDIDKEVLEESFPTGEVEDVVMLKDKKRRVDGREKKVVMGTGVVVFTSKSAAKKAVARGLWDGIQSVSWAAEKEADLS
ncbi:hypothetical protein DV736_g2083, partial [Chaetothyriales sp. CBS 134916]